LLAVLTASSSVAYLHVLSISLDYSVDFDHGMSLSWTCKLAILCCLDAKEELAEGLLLDLSTVAHTLDCRGGWVLGLWCSIEAAAGRGECINMQTMQVNRGPHRHLTGLLCSSEAC
jgi:hypothetical protein